MSFNQNHRSTPARARLADEQNYVPSNAAYPPAISSSPSQAITPTGARPVFEQPNYASSAAYAPAVPSDQNQASTPTVARPAIEQQNYGPPAAYYSPMSFERYQASGSTRSRPAVEQQGYDLPAAYPSTIPSDQYQASTPAVARPVIEQQNHGTPNRAFEHGRRDRAGFFATVMNPDTNATTPAHENTVRPSEQRSQAQQDGVGQNRAALTSRDQAYTAPRNPPVVMPNPNETAVSSAEHKNRTWNSQLEQRIQREMRPTSAAMAMEAERNRAAAISARRERVDRASEAEQRTQAQRDAIERNNNVLAARAHAVNASWNPPIVTAGANSALAVPAGRENMDRVSETEQRIRAETNATVAEQRRVARLAAARESMERTPEAEQRGQTQWTAINRAASSNPPISVSVADANRAGTPLAARDNDAAQDSLVSSPVITSARAPQSPTLDSAADDPTNFTTTPKQRSMINRYRPRAPWSTAELLQIKCTDPRYH